VRGKWRLFRQDAGRVAGPPAWVYIALFALCIAIGNWSSARYGAVVLWPANGVLLAALLQLHKRPAIGVLAACFAINLVGNQLRDDPTRMVVLNAALNLCEVLIAGVIARRFCGAALDMRRPARLARFVFLAAFPAVLLSAVIAIFAAGIPPSLFPASLKTYFAVETLGILMTTPTLLLIARSHRFATAEDARTWEKMALIGGLAVLTAAVFLQKVMPISFVIFVPLLVIAFRLPPAWSAVSVILVAVIAGTATMNGYGPITLTTLGPAALPNDLSAPVLRALPVFHLYICVLLCISLPASTVLTERRRLEEALRARTLSAVQARARAEQAAEAKARFLSMMSHEMRTPLNGVAGFAELLAGRPGLDAEARRQVDQIRRCSERLLALVDDVLDFSHGGMEVTTAPFAPARVIEDAVDAARAAATAKGLELTFASGLDAHARFVGDARRVRQLVQHLLSNAIKFTREGGVEVRLEETEAGIEVRVADSGQGLPPGSISSLFQPFAQLDASVGRAHEGAGMGLALCRRLVDAMNGEIGAGNRFEGGAEFWFRIPLPAFEMLAGPEPDPSETRALRVLVVDDHPINREVACVMLWAAGCETAIARDGVEAVEAVRDGGFDLILMDVRMPRMDGLQATRAIRALDGPSAVTPIVAMTADAMPEDVSRCLAAGMDGHMAKPISQSLLWTTLSRVLDRERAAEGVDAQPAAVVR
jgi:two-component system, sensor histidine kinase